MAEETPESPESVQPEAAEDNGADTPGAQPSVEQDAPDEARQPAAKKARWPWMLAGILILVLPLAWLLVPQDMRTSYIKRVTAWVGRPATQPPPSRPHTVQAPAPELQSTAPARPLASAADVAALRASMHALRQELEQTRRAQQAFMQAMRRHQRADLRMRLHWIVQPESRLAQLIAYWEDITLLSAQDSEFRARAEEMLQIARALDMRVHLWQRRLQAIADSLPAPVAEVVRIHPDNKWLAWFARQFRLSTAPSRKQRQLEALRHRCLAAGQQLAAGDWPEQDAWHALLEDIQREVGEDAVAGLPRDFSKAQDGIDSMRRTARSWLGRLNQATQRGAS